MKNTGHSTSNVRWFPPLPWKGPKGAARIASSLLAGAAFAIAADSPPPVSFNRDIRPIMSDTCFRCHGPDKSSRMAGMRLDIRDEALKPTRSKVIPIVPGDIEKSAIVQRVFATNGKIMPPKFAHKELTQKQKETIRRWVAEGAKYEGHWSYEAIKRPVVPEVSNAKFPIRNPIDAFIQTRLAKEGLSPSPEADKHILIRRVTLDLTGLPPTPEEVEAFVSDSSPEAYAKLVDRLLAGPRYAEQQTLHWLDAVRYADTAGFHGDNSFPAWPYRDYVLRAFRDNMPFDRFTREQFAGDLLPNPTVDQKVASAYNRLNRVSAEGGLQPKEYLAKYGADRVRTVSAVWLGLTTGCAECHDHKFDPILTKDFYSMKAFFADIKEDGLVKDRGGDAWGSKLGLPTPEQRSRLEELDRQLTAGIAVLDQKAEVLSANRSGWEKQVLARHASGALAWRYQRPLTAKSANGAKLTIYNDQPVDSNFYLNGSLASDHKPGEGLVAASGPNPDNETYTVTFKPGKGTWTALAVEVVQDESLPGNRVSRGADRFTLTEVEATLSSGKAGRKKLHFSLATTDGFGEPINQPPMAAIDGNPKTGWGTAFGEAKNPTIALRLTEKVRTTPGSIITVRLRHNSHYRHATIGRFRLALSSAKYSWPESGESSRQAKLKAKEKLDNRGTLTIATDRGLQPDLLTALQTPIEKRTDDQKKVIFKYFKWSYPSLQLLQAKLAKLQVERDLLNAEIPRVMITDAIEPRETRILPRGNWQDETGAVVVPAIPEKFGDLNTGGRRATRLDLANWIVAPNNPLTARTYVNRQWRQFFGIGISKILEDLGSQGEWPTHPELVDWLASEFMQPTWEAAGTHAWDMKHISRTIVMSHTYRQVSVSSPQMDERDPDNRLLAHQGRFRVDAEVVHDVALSVSGLLKEKFGGPSVFPYEPPGYLAAMNFPKREYSASRGDDLYRRGLYTQWQRTFLHPSLLTFDAPTREECTVNRVNSNTPLQALIVLNDPIFLEAARAFAQNILQKGGGSFEKQMDWAFERAVGREPDTEERKILSGLYQTSLNKFQAQPGDAKKFLSEGETPVPKQMKLTDLAAMTTVARAILNMHETITRN